MIKKRRPSEILCRINVTGFLSIIIVLLYTMIAYWTVGIPDLPRIVVSSVVAPHSIALPGAGREDAVILAVLRDGKIYLDTQLIYDPAELADHLRDRVHNSGEKTVYLNVDARVHYQAVNEVIAALQTAGIEKIAFLTEKPRNM